MSTIQPSTIQSIPPVHLVVMQPAGYLHSLGFLDQARYLRHQLRRLGAEVSMAKNRLREDAVNLVFGAHLGFPPALRERHTCLFFNLEQLGAGGAAVSPDYLALLRSSAVVDYDPANVASYCSDPDDVPVVPLMYAPYLDQQGTLPLEDRPIDLLFFGSINPRRQKLISRIEACGVPVSVFDSPLYGPERDDFIRQAKAVLNCHFYASSRFEQTRVAHCLSLGTPVFSERRPQTRPGPAFEDAVTWFDEQNLEQVFGQAFTRGTHADTGRQQLDNFRRHDPIEAYADLLAFMAGVHQGHRQTRPTGPWCPSHMRLGTGRDHQPGWLNIDPDPRHQPDLLLDLGQPLPLPCVLDTTLGGQVQLQAGQLAHIHTGDQLSRVADPRMLMDNALRLLQTGGLLDAEVPHEKSPATWENPLRRRAMNENSWACFTDGFWQLGWFEHRFELSASTWLDQARQPCAKDQAVAMRVQLRKVVTTARERTLARAMQPDFGGLPDDL